MNMQTLKHASADDGALGLADELAMMACYARELEQTLTDVQAVLAAIEHGDLLVVKI